MHGDRRGLAYSAESRTAVARFDEAVDHYLEYRLDTPSLIEAALAADPAFIMPRVLRASMLRLLGSNAVRPQIEAELAAIGAVEGPLTTREAMHVQALQQWVDGRVGAACHLWAAIARDWPHDLVALRHVHFQSFWLGEQRTMRDAVAGALGAWSADQPGYGFALGMLAFGHEETGDYRTAEALGREAVERNPEDLWAIHAVAHVMEMEGRLEEGTAWLDYPADRWADRGPIKNHVWWHGALFALERCDFDAVLALYDTHVRPGERKVSTDLMNAPSLLARLELAGVDVGDRWQRLADWAEGWVEDHVLAFTDAHTMIPLARTGRQAADTFVASLERFAAEPDNDAASRVGPYLLPIARAIRAFYEGRPAETVALLEPLRRRLLPIGGSHAQRDLFQQLLLEAAIRAGDLPLARELALERVELRPGNALNRLKLAAVEAMAPG